MRALLPKPRRRILAAGWFIRAALLLALPLRAELEAPDVESPVSGNPIFAMTWREADPPGWRDVATHHNEARAHLGAYQRAPEAPDELEAAQARLAAAFAQFEAVGPALPPGSRSQAAMQLHGLRHDLARAWNLRRVRAWDEQNRAEAATDPALWAAPGLRADVTARRIVLAGEFVAQVSPDPIEFFVIDRRSGHDYEALTVSFALAEDVDQALKRLGLEPGRPVDSAQRIFWPRGERVRLTLAWQAADGSAQTARAEEMIYDRRQERRLPTAGLVYTGSQWIERDGAPVLAAAAFEPHSIASTYNEPWSLLDVPWQANDSEVYGWQVAAPERLPPTGTFVELTLEPERELGAPPRALDVTLSVVAAAEPGALRYELVTAAGEPLTRGPAWHQLLAAFGRLTEAGRDPFVTVRLAPELTISQVQATYAQLLAIESLDGIRLEPPPAGHLFHRAFFMPEHLRDRERRGVQPWEVLLHPPDHDPAVTLLKMTERWEDERQFPLIEVAAKGFPDYAAAQARLQEDPGADILLIEAPPDLSYGDLLAFIAPLEATHPTCYVFITPPES